MNIKNIENKKVNEEIVESLEKKTDTNYGIKKVFDQYKFAYKNNLAKFYYDFLTKKSNKLPNFKYVDTIIKKNDGQDFVISVGYGLFVMFDGSKLYIRYEEPLSEKSIKVEEFFPKRYDIKIQTYSGSNSNIKTAEEEKKKPSFEKTRIIVVLNYLKQYYNHRLDLETEKNKIK